MRWTVIWAATVSGWILYSANSSAQRLDRYQEAHDRQMSKIDDANAQADALNAELAALKRQAEQDPENLRRALSNISSLEQLFVVAEKYPLWRMGNNDLYYAFQTKFHSLSKESLSNLKPDSVEYREAVKRNKARYSQLQGNAANATVGYFNRTESILARMRIHLDYAGNLIDLADQRIKGQQEAEARRAAQTARGSRLEAMPETNRRRGGYVGVVDPAGRVMDANGNYRGTHLPDGRFINSDGSFGGFVDPAGRVMDAHGNYRGTQLPDGRFINSDGSFGGFIDPAGRIILSE